MGKELKKEIEEFLETKTFHFCDDMAGYRIGYAYLVELIKEFVIQRPSQKSDELVEALRDVESMAQKMGDEYYDLLNPKKQFNAKDMREAFICGFIKQALTKTVEQSNKD